MKKKTFARSNYFVFIFGCGVVLVALIAFLFIGSLKSKSKVYSGSGNIYSIPGLRPISNIRFLEPSAPESNNPDFIKLPGSISGLAPRTEMSLGTDISFKAGDCLFIKTVYTELNLYADDELIYSVGKKGSYPQFLLDPPTIITLVNLPEGKENVFLRFDFVSPSERSVMSLPSVLVGDSALIFDSILNKNLFSLLFSLLLIVLGALFSLTARTILRNIPEVSAILWLGLFAICTGVWVLGENDISFFILPYPSLLYIMAFTGLFSLAIPFIKFGMVVLKPKNDLPLKIILWVLIASCISAFGLQLLGIVNLSKTMYFFHMLVPVSFIGFAVFLIWEAVKNKNKTARHFFLPILILALSTIAELVNYSLRFTEIISLFFQMGALVFVLWLGVIGAFFARDAINAEIENKQLETEITATGKQLALQREQYDLLTQNVENAKKIKHDIKHHIAVLTDLAEKEDTASLKLYLHDLSSSSDIDSDSPLCENYAVNAVVKHYIAGALKNGVRVETLLNVPDKTGDILAADLCILFGNLIENASEAALSLPKEKRFVRIKADAEKGYLLIAIDNSFDGSWREDKGVFLSRKRDYKSEGIGISSINAIAEKYNGYSDFKIINEVFEASVVVMMKKEE